MEQDIKKGKAVRAWARLILSAAILGFVFTQVDFSQLSAGFLKARPQWLVVGALIVLLEEVILSLWWSAMLSGKGYHAPFSALLRISFVSDFLGFVMPSSMGADLVKVAGLSKYISSVTEALSSLLAFRVINYALMFSMALITVIFFSEFLPAGAAKSAIIIFLASFPILLGLSVFFARTGLRLAEKILVWINKAGLFEKLEAFYVALSYFASARSVLLKSILAGAIIQFNRIIYMYIISLALGIDVELAMFFVFVPIVTAITMIPVSISGIGVREGGYVLLFGYVGVSAEQALGLSLVGFSLAFVPVFLGGLLYWVSGFPDQQKLEELKSGPLAN